jgi:hypothetical protein
MNVEYDLDIDYDLYAVVGSRDRAFDCLSDAYRCLDSGDLFGSVGKAFSGVLAEMGAVFIFDGSVDACETVDLCGWFVSHYVRTGFLSGELESSIDFVRRGRNSLYFSSNPDRVVKYLETVKGVISAIDLYLQSRVEFLDVRDGDVVLCDESMR